MTTITYIVKHALGHCNRNMFCHSCNLVLVEYTTKARCEREVPASLWEQPSAGGSSSSIVNCGRSVSFPLIKLPLTSDAWGATWGPLEGRPSLPLHVWALCALPNQSKAHFGNGRNLCVSANCSLWDISRRTATFPPWVVTVNTIATPSHPFKNAVNNSNALDGVLYY